MKVAAMTKKRHSLDKRYFSAAEANAMLPLVRAIVTDIAELARELRERHERLTHIPPSRRGALTDAHKEELELVEADLERGQEKMRDYEKELRQLGVEL